MLSPSLLFEGKDLLAPLKMSYLGYFRLPEMAVYYGAVLGAFKRETMTTLRCN
jgi:hypothetical protein